MKRRFTRLLTAVLALVLFCRIEAAAAVDTHIVTQVEVDCRQAQSRLYRRYTQSRKMETVLNYLRLAKYAGMPEEIPGKYGDICYVTVRLANGSSHVYDLLDWQYLSRDGGAWELAELPEPYLPQLLEQMPSDP